MGIISLQANIDDQLNTVAPMELDLGYGLQVVNISKTSPYNVLNIVGRTLVNLLGRDGNFEFDANADGVADRWEIGASGQGTYSLDTTSAKYGLKSQRITAASADTSTARRIQRSDIAVKLNSCYIALVDVVTDGTGLVSVRVDYDATFTETADSAQNKIHYVKFKPATATSTIIRLYNHSPLAATNWVQFDGFRLYEITQAEYDALATMTNDQIAKKYPYVDDVKHVNAPYIIKYGENLSPSFNEWTLHTNAKVTEPYGMSHTATATEDSYYSMNATPNQTYTLSGMTTGVGEIFVTSLDSIGAIITESTHIKSGSLSFTLPVNATGIRLYARATGAGSATFSNIMLTTGTITKPFKPRNDDRLFFPETKVASNLDGTVYDQIYRQDGKWWRENRFAKDVVLDGSLTWAFSSDLAGFKQLSVPITSNIIVDTGVVVKYDGKILSRFLAGIAITSSDAQALTPSGGQNLYITIADVDSGWTEAFVGADNYWSTGSVTASTMLKAYFNGWKVNSNVSPSWISIGDNTTQSTDPVFVVNNIAPKYMPYKLTYQLATPTFEEISAEGGISVHEGGNQFEVGTGMIVREKANPVYRSSDNIYWLNVDRAKVGSVVGSELTKRADILVQVFRNSKVDSRWNLLSNVSAGYGKGYARCSAENFDPTAVYEVTYLALDQYLLSSSVQTINGEYNWNIKTTVDSVALNQADLDSRVGVLENTKASKSQPNWITSTLMNAWANQGAIPTQAPASYYKNDMNEVKIRGYIGGGTSTAGTVILILPVGYRPSIRVYITTASSNGTAWGTAILYIEPTGELKIDSVTGVSGLMLDPIEPFLAEK